MNTPSKLDEARLRELPTNDPTNPLHRLGDDLAEGRIKDMAVSADVAYALRRITELEDALSAEREEHEEAEETIEACQRLIAQHWDTITAERERADRAVAEATLFAELIIGLNAPDQGASMSPESRQMFAVASRLRAFLATQKAEV